MRSNVAKYKYECKCFLVCQYKPRSIHRPNVLKKYLLLLNKTIHKHILPIHMTQMSMESDVPTRIRWSWDIIPTVMISVMISLLICMLIGLCLWYFCSKKMSRSGRKLSEVFLRKRAWLGSTNKHIIPIWVKYQWNQMY